MQFSFRTLSTFTAALCFLLALGLGFIQTRRVSVELGETAG